MKKTTLIIAIAFLSASLFNSTVSKAQEDEHGKSVITAGVGTSLAGFLFTAIKDVLNYDGTVSSSSTPVLIGSYDYSIAEKFSLGAAYSYQSITVNYSQYKNDTATINGDFKDRLSRQNFGIRPLFHFGSNENVDGYFGARISYTIWKYTSNVRNDVNLTNSSVLGNRVHVQAVLGGRYFFTDNVGVNLEFAIGPSYYAMGGLNFRF
jgi:hypothetical protein